jgi:nickel-dependent lactate racemase
MSSRPRTSRVRLAYGTTGLEITVPDDATVVRPAHRRAVDDDTAAVRAALERPVEGPPLRDLVGKEARVAIAVCDATRPQPRRPMLAAIAEVLDGVVPAHNVVVLVATGTHGPSSQDQRREMLGDEILAKWRVVDHDARDQTSLREVGRIDGVPVALNREWLAADVRITTGFVEPHFFAGFSGGPKMVAPGLAALETVLELHSPVRIADPRSTFGVVEGNPVHDPVRAIAAATGVTFSVDVLIDSHHRITHAFGGPVLAMHAAACRVAREVAMLPVAGPFDIVVTTNSGYPLDRNLYQTVKGIAAGGTVVAEGGTILCAAECRDGLPDDGRYARLLRGAPSIQAAADEVLAATRTIPDGWQVQVQARVQARARVMLQSKLAPADVRAAHLEPIDDVGSTLAALLREQPMARVCVLPEGPQTIPYLNRHSAMARAARP